MKMLKNFSAGCIVLLVFACRPVKKVESIQTAIQKKDTAQTVVVKETPKIDSGAIVKGIISKIVSKKIDFTTFNAKIKTDYYGQEESQNFTVYLSMAKDSVIYAQLKGFMGVVGLQAKITKDSVIIVRKFGEKYVQKRSLSYLQEVTQIPFDFYTLQDILIGNPVFIDSNIASYKISGNQILALMVGNIFKNLITIDDEKGVVTHSKLDDTDPLRNRTCDITYSTYQPAQGFLFSTYRSVSVAEKAKLDVNLDFKEYSFNEPLKYVFTIPKNYKVK